MSDDSDFPFSFAFGEGAGEEFKERLKELMRAQREAFEEMQAESGGQPLTGVDRWQVIQQAVLMASAGLRALQPQATPRFAWCASWGSPTGCSQGATPAGRRASGG
jgi:hypothetical protein